MGFLDKAKAQAEQAMAKAQHGMVQGQARLDQVQAKRQSDALLRSLGSAYYAQERQGGAPEAVSSAMAALDTFAAEQGSIDTTGTAGGASPSAPGTPPPGDFTLGDD